MRKRSSFYSLDGGGGGRLYLKSYLKLGAKWARWYFPDEIFSFQARLIRAMLICSPIFTNIAAFCYKLLTAVFPSAPSSFIYYLYGQLGVLVDQENHDQPTVFRPCTPSTDNPGLVRHYIIGRGLTSIFVLFRCTNLQNKIVLHKPALWSVLNPFLLVPKSENPQFFYMNSTSKFPRNTRTYGLKIM